MPPTPVICSTCKFYIPIDDTKGYCYRYAPRPSMNSAASKEIIHPTTKADESGCGDYVKA